MTDRELLELAAKAAGYEYFHDGCEGIANIPMIKVNGTFKVWMPLSSGSDALSLAGFLKMRIEFHVRHPFVAVFIGTESTFLKIEEKIGEDTMLSACRAIVRSAAETGKAMQ